MIEEFFLSDFSGGGKLIKAGIMEGWKKQAPIIPIFQVLDIPIFHSSIF